MYSGLQSRVFIVFVVMSLISACSGSASDGTQGGIPESSVTSPQPVPTTAPEDTTSPTTPANIQVSNFSSTTISLTWDAASDNVAVTGYRLYKNSNQVAFASTTSQSFTDTGLQPGQIYAYQISAVDAAGNESAKSAVLSVRTLAPSDTASPTTPTSLRSTSVATNTITLAWNAATDNVAVTAYRLYKNGSLTPFASPTSLSFTDTGLLADHAYTYRVSAVDAAGNESAKSAILSVSTQAAADTAAPSTPTSLRSTSVGSDSIALAWNAATDNVAVTGYRLYKNGSLTPFASPTSLSFTDTGLLADNTYEYRVSAIDAAGNESGLSSVLVVNTVAAPDTTPPATPANLHSTSVSSDSIALAWNAATDNVAVTAYRLYKDGSSTPLVTTSGLSTTDTGLLADHAYTYRISAVDAAGNESPLSSALSVTTSPQAVSSSVNLQWDTPTKNTDDSCIDGVQMYKLSYGAASGTYQASTDVMADSADLSCVQVDFDASCNQPIMRCSYSTQPLQQGSWYFAIQAYDLSGVSSGYSNEVLKQIN